MSMRALEGSRFSTSALRTITAVDNPLIPVDNLLFTSPSPKQKCLGTGVLYLMAGPQQRCGDHDRAGSVLR